MAQSILLREAQVVMFGSELAWGVVLSSWLLGVGLGGSLGAWLSVRVRRADLWLVSVLLVLGVAACGGLWAFRSLRFWLDVGPGELLSLWETLAVATFVTTPVSTPVGAAFALACRAAQELRASPGAAAGTLGWIYGLESLGSLVGGAAFTFWAVAHLPAIATLMLSVALSALLAAAFVAVSGHRRIVAVALLVVGVGLVATTWVFGNALDRKLVLRRFRALAPHHELVAWTESPHQSLAVGRLAGQNTLYCDGQVAAHFPDPYAYVPLAHFWMCQHPASRPGRVLLFGGGAEGLLAEILRHPVRHIDYVEPDPRSVDLIAPFLPEADSRALDDPRVTLHRTDARLFIKMARRPYDIVIARLPEPTSASRARYYTREFFVELRRVMSRRSVLCLTAVAAPGALSPSAAEYLATLRATLRTAFARVTVSFGNPAHLLAETEPGLVSGNADVLRRRYAERAVHSDLFDPVWFDGATDWLDLSKVTQRAAQLDQVEDVEVCTDMRPSVYLQRLVLWNEHTGRGRAVPLFERLRRIRPWGLFSVLGLAVALAMVAIRMRVRSDRGWQRGAVLMSVLTSGFATMALSIIWMFAFQSLYGYVYERIGWIIALFMAGLVIGSATCTTLLDGRGGGPRRGPPARKLTHWLATADGLLAALAAAAPVCLRALARLPSSEASLVLVELLVSALVTVTGLLGGASFALAGGVRALGMEDPKNAAAAAGGVVAADHVGACLGALLTGLYLAPVLGTAAAAALLVVAKLGSAALLIGTQPRR